MFVLIGSSCRLSKDYEILLDADEAMVKIAHIHTLMPGLAAS